MRSLNALAALAVLSVVGCTDPTDPALTGTWGGPEATVTLTAGGRHRPVRLRVGDH